jgi:subtilisin family serine protease
MLTRRQLVAALAILVVAVSVAAQALAAPPPRVVPGEVPDQDAPFVPGEVIVRFKAGTTPSERLAVRRVADAGLERSLQVSQAQLLEVEGGVKAAVEQLELQPDVAFAQPNYRYEALAAPAPNDPLFGSLWGLQDPAAPNPGVDALEAWDTTRGAGQVIAVVDTGVALDHPDLDDNAWDNPGETPGGGDDDLNGHGDDVHGYDFVDDDPDPDDYNFHGTHVAGTAAAEYDNSRGIAGVAPEAEIMAVRVLDGDGSGTSADIGDGIAYAALEGADVINLSLGGLGASDSLMASGIAVADSQDAVVVAAAGNDALNNDTDPSVPCVLPNPNLICVAAVNQSGGLASFSSYGPTTVDVGGPGTNILSAQASYASIFDDSFSAGIGNWTTSTLNGALAWGAAATPNSDGNGSATDSPGGLYANSSTALAYAESRLVKTSALNLTSERGCRIHFDVRYDLESDFDYLEAGAIDGSLNFDGTYFTGSTGGSFFGEEVSISDLDGQPAVKPWFTVLSDDSVRADGAYLDDLHVLCRDTESPGDSGAYVAFNGTSMATPHVAGVAALVRAAAPGATDTDAIDAIKQGGAPLASLAGKTATGCTADADGAIAIALGAPDPGTCSVSSPPQSKPPAAQPTPQASPPTAPAKPNLSSSPSTVRVTRKGVLVYRFRATPGLTGTASFKTRVRAVVSRRAHLTIGRKPFAVGPTGRVTVRVKLSKRNLRHLRHNKRLLLNATVTVRNAAGLSAKAVKRLTLRPPRR